MPVSLTSAIPTTYVATCGFRGAGRRSPACRRCRRWARPATLSEPSRSRRSGPYCGRPRGGQTFQTRNLCFRERGCSEIRRDLDIYRLCRGTHGLTHYVPVGVRGRGCTPWGTRGAPALQARHTLRLCPTPRAGRPGTQQAGSVRPALHPLCPYPQGHPALLPGHTPAQQSQLGSPGPSRSDERTIGCCSGSFGSSRAAAFARSAAAAMKGRGSRLRPAAVRVLAAHRHRARLHHWGAW
jgi:hypothetical protein